MRHEEAGLAVAHRLSQTGTVRGDRRRAARRRLDVAGRGDAQPAPTLRKVTSVRPRGRPRLPTSARVLAGTAPNAARRYTRGISRSAAQTTVAIGQLASAKAVVPNRCGTITQNGRAGNCVR